MEKVELMQPTKQEEEEEEEEGQISMQKRVINWLCLWTHTINFHREIFKRWCGANVDDSWMWNGTMRITFWWKMKCVCVCVCSVNWGIAAVEINIWEKLHQRDN